MSSEARSVDGLFVEGSSRPGSSETWSLLTRALREPGHALEVLLAILHGFLFTQWARLFRPRVQIGRGLRIYGRLSIRGPGVVVLGDEVQIYGKVTPWTNAAAARIEVGDFTKLDGTRFSCVRSIRIGKNCLIANGRILDTAFHSVGRMSGNTSSHVLEAPVVVEDNVWISSDAGLLPGTRIGRDSVVAMGAVCKGEYPVGVMIFGNPARVAGPVS